MVTRKKVSSLAFRLLWLLAIGIASIIHAVDGRIIKQGRIAYDKVYKQ